MKKALVGCSWTVLIIAATPLAAQGLFFWPPASPNAQARPLSATPKRTEKLVEKRPITRAAVKLKSHTKPPHGKHTAARANNSFATKTQVSLQRAELSRAFADQIHNEVKRIDDHYADLATRLHEEQKQSDDRYAELSARIMQEQGKPALTIRDTQSASIIDREVKRLDSQLAHLTARLDDEVKRARERQTEVTTKFQDELTRLNSRHSEFTASIPPPPAGAVSPLPDARYAELAARTDLVERDLKAAVEQKPLLHTVLGTALIAALVSVLSAGAVAFFNRSRTIADNRAKLSFELAAEYWRNIGLYGEALGILRDPAAFSHPVNESKVKSIGDFFERLSFAALSKHADPQMLDRLGMKGTLQSFWRALERSEKKGVATKALMEHWKNIKALSTA